MAKKVTITKAKYERLLTTQAHMDELEARGVDNWGEWVGRQDDCDECGADFDWGHEECPKCGAEISHEYW